MTAAIPTLAAASRAIADGSLSPVALTEAALARIADIDERVHAFIRVTADRARATAATAEADIAAGRRRGPLHGIPYALKDLFDVAGLPTTAQSHVLIDNVAAADAPTTAALEAAGMILLGKLTTHEFAIGAPNHETPFPPARNPWNTDHFAGGSSSGSGVAVATGMIGLALGTDTGGSIRLPAAYCGIVGLKATYGRVSRRGCIPLSFSLDHCGPLSRTVEDCALALQAIAFHDPSDSGSADRPVPDYAAALEGGVAGLRIGYCRDFGAEVGVDAEQQAALDAAAATLVSLGAEIVHVTLPPARTFEAAIWITHHAEAFAIHQRDLRGRPGDYARVTRERLMMGAFVTGTDYVQAQRLRRVLTSSIDALFDGGCDALLISPITGPAPRLDEVDDGPWRKSQPITAPFNATGHPALCLPCGLATNRLPMSMQLVGRAFDESTLLRIGHAFEQATTPIGLPPI